MNISVCAGSSQNMSCEQLIQRFVQEIYTIDSCSLVSRLERIEQNVQDLKVNLDKFNVGGCSFHEQKKVCTIRHVLDIAISLMSLHIKSIGITSDEFIRIYRVEMQGMYVSLRNLGKALQEDRCYNIFYKSWVLRKSISKWNLSDFSKQPSMLVLLDKARATRTSVLGSISLIDITSWIHLSFGRTMDKCVNMMAGMKANNILPSLSVEARIVTIEHKRLLRQEFQGLIDGLSKYREEEQESNEVDEREFHTMSVMFHMVCITYELYSVCLMCYDETRGKVCLLKDVYPNIHDEVCVELDRLMRLHCTVQQELWCESYHELMGLRNSIQESVWFSENDEHYEQWKKNIQIMLLDIKTLDTIHKRCQETGKEILILIPEPGPDCVSKIFPSEND